VNLPRIGAEGASATTLRDRALAGLNGESRGLAAADQERRRRVLRLLRAAQTGRGDG
jgi:hypothetical protein